MSPLFANLRNGHGSAGKNQKTLLIKKVIDAHTDQQVGYDTLTPKIITDDSVKPYFDALDFAFTKQDVKNIAITGPYGAGKSTVILSYLQSRLKRTSLLFRWLIFRYQVKAIKICWITLKLK